MALPDFFRIHDPNPALEKAGAPARLGEVLGIEAFLSLVDRIRPGDLRTLAERGDAAGLRRLWDGRRSRLNIALRQYREIDAAMSALAELADFAFAGILEAKRELLRISNGEGAGYHDMLKGEAMRLYGLIMKAEGVKERGLPAWRRRD